MADFWDDNAPPPQQFDVMPPLAGGGAPPTGGGGNFGGGWNEGPLSPAAKALQQAFSQGLTGEAAVNAANSAAGLQPPNSISFGDGGYGLPGGQYVAPNAAKGGQLDMITRGGGGGGGGGGGDFQGAPGWGSGTSAPGAYTPPTFRAPAPFVAPTGLTEANDPGFQARMKMGTDALQGAAASRGSLLSGGTLKALERYGQDYGSNEFGNVYGRAAGAYNMNTANDWRQQENQAQYGLSGYQTNVATQRNAQQDYWARLQSLYQGGLGATQGTYQRPPGF